MTEKIASQIYRGVIVPMITPLDKNGAIDEVGVKNIVGNLVANRCSPFVACTTGESASLSDSQKEKLVEIVVTEAAGRELVYAGIADNCYSESIEKAKRYQSLGADVVVSHLPCYYSLDDAQMKSYFAGLADESPLPLIMYNIPVTTHHSIPLPLIDELSHHENIVGLKDSERGDERLAEGLRLWRDRDDFTFHLGWAAMSSYGLQNGLDGIVPSSGNLVPELYRRIYDAAKDGENAEADRLQAITNEISAYYQEGYPLSRSIPMFKAMMDAFDICQPYAAPPMLTLTAEDQAVVKADVIERFGQFVT